MTKKMKFHFKIKFMQALEEKLISECKTQLWAKKMINKPIQEVEKINPYSISSVKQRLITKK